tara:strand:+ start:827 stop:1606 length:780 start_codon:yes stop_codon:yes gene_type:complete
MGRFAVGKDAYGISDRSGFRYRLRDMRKEWNGLLVGKDEWEAKHPQLEPVRHPPDAEALRDPRPDTQNIFNEEIKFPVFSTETLQYVTPVFLRGSVGTVTFSDNVVTPTYVSVNGVSAIGSIGSVTVTTTEVPVSGISATGSVGSVTVSTSGAVITQTFTVTVVSTGYGNKYYIDGVQQATVNLSEGSTYRFDQSDSSNSGHPLRLSTTSDGTHGGGSQYTTGVTTTSTYTQITVAVGAPTLYYYCTNHSGMGGQANTP